MDAIVSLEVERLKIILDYIGKKFKGDMSGIFGDEIISFLEKEIQTVISVSEDISLQKELKMVRISKAFGRFSGIEKTIEFMSPIHFGGKIPYSISLLSTELKGIQNSITKILMNL